MTTGELKQARLKRGYNQSNAAARAGVTQAYFSMLENGRRTPSSELARRLMRLYGLSSNVLPVSDPPGTLSADFWASELGSLGYPGFAHLTGRKRMNPASFLLSALAQSNLEARVTEALPWLVFRYPDMNFDWLVPRARMTNLQNRLGFTVTLARLASRRENLEPLECLLTESKLEKQDSFCKELSAPERRWLEEHSSPEARQWNLLSDMSPDALRYVA